MGIFQNALLAGAAAAATAGGDGFSLYGWGLNGSGELGLDDTTNRSSPVQIGTLTDWAGEVTIQNKKMTPATETTSFVKSDGTMWSFGKESYGELGVGTTNAQQSSPVQVGSLTDWDKVVGGNGSILAIKTDGTLWGWGGNWSGQLGLGGLNINYSSPVQVGSDADWTDIGLGKNAGMGIRDSGKFFTWGHWEANGQNKVSYSSPVQIGSATNWTSTRCAGDNSFAIAGGNMYTTGNGGGVLGDGTTNYSRIWVQVGSLTDWSKTCGNGGVGYTAMVLKTDSTIWGWGYNYSGMLAANSANNYSSPIQVGDDSDWIDIQLGGYHSIGIRDSGDGETGTLWTWGANGYGQLGLGNTDTTSAITQVGSESDWRAVIGGNQNSFGIR